MKAYGQKAYRRHNYLSTLPRPSIPYKGKMEQILLAYSQTKMKP